MAMMELNENERKEIEKRNKNKIDRESDDLRRILATAEGRRYLTKLMYKACAIDQNLELIETSFNTNTASGNFTEGSRRFGILMFNEILRVSPQSIIQMRNENESDRRSEEK